jgi:hypothetical protein
VLVIVLLTVVRNGWALYGPAADLDAVEAQLDRKREERGSRYEHRRDRRDQRRLGR